MKKPKTIKELAEFLGKSEATIYNWKKDNPNLHKVVISYLDNNENVNEENYFENEIIKALKKLPKNKTKKYYYLIMAELAEMGH